MKNKRLGLGATVVFCGALTMFYLLTSDNLAQYDAIGTLSFADLLLAICILSWFTVILRWLVISKCALSSGSKHGGQISHP